VAEQCPFYTIKLLYNDFKSATFNNKMTHM